MNRHRKGGKDAGEWLPRMNRCWFAARVVAVKRRYRLTVDAREARAHGIAPVRRGHPAYPFMRDGDGDGVMCE